MDVVHLPITYQAYNELSLGKLSPFIRERLKVHTDKTYHSDKADAKINLFIMIWILFIHEYWPHDVLIMIKND